MSKSKTTAEESEHEKMGKRLRKLRLTAGISQAKLGTLLPNKSVKAQQIQKYEKGLNRISAVRLKHFADILGVPVTRFYEDKD